MIQLIVNAFVEKDKTGAVVEVLYASSNHEKVRAKYEELVAQYPENYLAIYDLPMDTDLNTLDHYPSVWIGKEEFEQESSYYYLLGETMRSVKYVYKIYDHKKTS